MFFDALIPYLRADGELATVLSTHTGHPSVFAEMAPESATTPFIVCSFRGSPTPDHVVVSGDLSIDFFDSGTSWKNAEKAAKRAEVLLDAMKLTSTDFTDIRFSFSSGGTVEGSDPRDIHYNAVYGVRMIRKTWLTKHSLLT